MKTIIRKSLITDVDDFIPLYNEDKIYLTDIKNHISNFPSYTLVIDNKIIALGGVINNYSKVWSSWNIVATGYKRYNLTIYKSIVTIFNKLIKDLERDKKIRRLQALVSSDRFTAIRLNEALGFKFEALLYEYDYYLKDTIIMTKFFD